jgi:tetratricopeptide (TPR) repeat protein
MPDAAAEARIQDLKRRIELDPGSRLFIALAEEYRKSGRLAEALSTLQRGLLAHPNYLSAQVALGRAYLESGQVTEAIATFSRVLVADPGNLVSAKSLADIYLSRGESLEAVKKYKLYRALSGDRAMEDVIARLEKELAPPPPAAASSFEASVPPPPAFAEEPKGPVRRSEAATAPAEGSSAAEGPFDLSPVGFETRGAPVLPSSAEPFGALVGEPPGAGAPAQASADFATRAFRASEILGAPSPPVREPPSLRAVPEAAAAASEPQGRTLADLYFAQGHYAEALRIYDELVAVNPFDEELRRLRRDAEARLLPAGSASIIGTADPVFERRLKKIRALKQWLSVLQAG